MFTTRYRTLLVLFSLASAATPIQAQVRISQIFGGGGNAGAAYKNDFIELFNAGKDPVDLGAYSVQYGSASGTSWNFTLLTGTIQPGHYFLIQEAAGTAGTLDLPTPDAAGTIPMSLNNGKVVLVKARTALPDSICPAGPDVVDFIGYGTGTKMCSETNPTAPLSNTTSASRNLRGYQDTNNNSADFTVSTGTNNFTARNSSVNAFGAIGSGTPDPVATGSTTTLTVNLTPFADSTGIVVACDLSPIGGPALVNLPTIAGNTYAAAYTVPGTIVTGTYTIACTVSDAQTHFATFSFPQGVAGSSAPPTAVGSASPSTLYQGASTHLSAVITSGTNPPSGSTSASCNLVPIGGGATIALPVDYTVPLTTAANTYALSCTVTDDLSRSSTFSISLTVQTAPPTFRTLAEVNGPGLSSPYAGERVQVRGVVTGIRGTTGSTKGFYLESLPADRDADPNTSEGLLVFMGNTAPPACAVLGNYVQIEGGVQDYIPSTAPVGSLPLTELSATANCTVLGTDQLAGLPAAVTLDSTKLSASGPASQGRKFVGMRVTVPQSVTLAGSLGSVSERTATSSPSGDFFVILPGAPRPFRTTGISDTRRPSDAAATVPHYTNHPEVLRIDSMGLTGGIAFELANGSTVGPISGIMDYDTAGGVFQVFTNAAGVGAYPAAPTLSVTPLDAPLPTDLTIANFNTQHFYNDKYDTGNSTVLDTDAYQGRLNKLSLAVRTVLRSPDIITFEEFEAPKIGGTSPETWVAQDVVNKLNNDTVAAGLPNPNYNWCEFATNDPSFISIAVVYKQTKMSVQECTQYGGPTSFLKPLPPNNPGLLNDRPPVVFRATVTAPGSDSGLPIRVVANHLRSFDAVDAPGDTGDFPRAKRNEQAKYIAKLISGNLPAEQTSNWTLSDNLVVTGDFNAYEFSDGYVDSLNCVAGNPGTADQQYFSAAELAVSTPCTSLFTPPLVNLTNTDPLTRYSYSFSGTAQRIDHILVNSRMSARVRQFAYAHNNVDFPEGPTYRNNFNRPERISDHDMPMVYLKLPVEVTSRTRLNASAPGLNRATGRYNATISVTNTGSKMLTGPVYVFFGSLTDGVTLPDLPKSDGVPYATINVGAGLAPGATSATVLISFVDPTNARIGYTTRRFDGSF